MCLWFSVRSLHAPLYFDSYKFNAESGTCVDIDECTENLYGECGSAVCTNTDGGVVCGCDSPLERYNGAGRCVSLCRNCAPGACSATGCRCPKEYVADGFDSCVPDCTELNDCNGNGKCVSYNKCECYAGANGLDERDCSPLDVNGDREFCHTVTFDLLDAAQTESLDGRRNVTLSRCGVSVRLRAVGGVFHHQLGASGAFGVRSASDDSALFAAAGQRKRGERFVSMQARGERSVLAQAKGEQSVWAQAKGKQSVWGQAKGERSVWAQAREAESESLFVDAGRKRAAQPMISGEQSIMIEFSKPTVLVDIEFGPGFVEGSDIAAIWFNDDVRVPLEEAYWSSTNYVAMNSIGVGVTAGDGFGLRSFTLRNPNPAPRMNCSCFVFNFLTHFFLCVFVLCGSAPPNQAPAPGISIDFTEDVQTFFWVYIVVAVLLCAVCVIGVLVYKRQQLATLIQSYSGRENAVNDAPVYGQDDEYEWSERAQTGKLVNKRKGTEQHLGTPPVGRRNHIPMRHDTDPAVLARQSSSKFFV